jgi:tetratricopeptide (TPR) repeat protein
MLLPVLVAISALAAQHPQHGHGAATDSVPLYDNLGGHHYEITTAAPRAQAYFDQGLRLYYGFNHAEAVRSFREAQRLDPNCAMCWWGEALAWGPNINLPMDSAGGVAAYAAVQGAIARQEHANERERALIEALAVRYAAVPAADRAGLDSAYAQAMEDVVRRYPENIEAAVLYAESRMDLRPWNYWMDDGQPQPGTTELLAQLERAMAADPNHPGACHFYIHAVEKVEPQRAVPCAERLASLMPGAGHIVHMPGHIYIRVGRYQDAIEANEHAVHADETYIQDARPGVGVYTAGYYPHNYDFMAFAATMVGRSEKASWAAQRVASVIPEEILNSPDLTFVQHYATRPLQVWVRFGRWEEILDYPEPGQNLLHARGIWNYARGRALAANGDIDAAEAHLERLRALAQDPALDGVIIEPNLSQAILAIAVHVLAGRIAEARGDLDQAIADLEEGARLEDALLYGEPPEWTIPVRHDLGAVLLAAGQPEEAERVYREDLERFPENGWSLLGLAQSLEAQGEQAAAEQMRQRFRATWASADLTIAASSI